LDLENKDSEAVDKQKLSNQVKLLGQIPQAVSENVDGQEDDVEIIEGPSQPNSQAENLMEINEVEAKALKAVKVPVQFSFGRVVKRNSGDKVSSTAAEAKTEVIINGRIHTVYEVAGGKIRFVHPDNDDYDVCCLSLVCAKLWLRKFYVHKNAGNQSFPSNGLTPVNEAKPSENSKTISDKVSLLDNGVVTSVESTGDDGNRDPTAATEPPATNKTAGGNEPTATNKTAAGNEPSATNKTAAGNESMAAIKTAEGNEAIAVNKTSAGNESISEDLKEMEDKLKADSKEQPFVKRTLNKNLPKLVRMNAGAKGKQATYGMLIQSRREKEESRLFYDLGRTALRQCFTKNTTKDQILKMSKVEIASLRFEGSRLENQKQVMMRRRAKLFEDFTKGLEGLPIDQKKEAVAKLKHLLSSKEPAFPLEKTEKTREPKRVQITVNKIKESPSQAAAPVARLPAGHPTPYTDVTGIQTVRADGSIIKPMRSFSIWANEKKAEYLARGVPAKSLAQYLAKTWALLNDKSKIRYIKEAKHLKILHSIQHPNFYTEEDLRLLKSQQAVSKAPTEQQAFVSYPSTSAVSNPDAISTQAVSQTAIVSHQAVSQTAVSHQAVNKAAVSHQTVSQPAIVSQQVVSKPAIVSQVVGKTAVIQQNVSIPAAGGEPTVSRIAVNQPAVSKPVMFVASSSQAMKLETSSQGIKIGQSILSKSQPSRPAESALPALLPVRTVRPPASPPPLMPRPSLPAHIIPSPSPSTFKQIQPRPSVHHISVQSLRGPPVSSSNRACAIPEEIPRSPVQVSSNINQDTEASETAASVNIPAASVNLPAASINNTAASGNMPAASGTLDLSDIPADAADVLGLALQSSGLQDISEVTGVSHEEWSQEQYKPGVGLIVQSPGQQQVNVQQRRTGQQQLVVQQQQQQRRQYVVQQQPQPQLQEQQIVYLDDDVIEEVDQIRANEEMIHVAGENIVMSQNGRQILLGSSYSGEQIILESDHQSQQVYLQEDGGGEVYLQPDGAGGHVYVHPQQLQNELYIQPEQTESQVFVEAAGSQNETGEVFLQTSESGEQVYVDEHGRQVVFQQSSGSEPQYYQTSGGEPQYYMQNGEIFQIIGDDVTQID